MFTLRFQHCKLQYKNHFADCHDVVEKEKGVMMSCKELLDNFEREKEEFKKVEKKLEDSMKKVETEEERRKVRIWFQYYIIISIISKIICYQTYICYIYVLQI